MMDTEKRSSIEHNFNNTDFASKTTTFIFIDEGLSVQFIAMAIYKLFSCCLSL